jgi:hypothetical protein
MFEPAARPHWPDLVGPLTEASMALGEPRHALGYTSLHRAWLWRETARMATRLGQNAGRRLSYEQLVQGLAGLPVERGEDHGGVAFGRGIFLVAGRLFRALGAADSIPAPAELFAPIWGSGARDDDDPSAPCGQGVVSAPSAACVPPGAGRAGGAEADGGDDLTGLRDLVRHLVSAAHRETVPLVGLLNALRSGQTRHLSPTLARLALPLALHQAGLVPKVAPALLGGRLPLATASPMPTAIPATPWLARALTALAKEAAGSARRLDDLTRQHRAWHSVFAGRGHRDSRAPKVLDLLAATPVLSTSLVARHLGCTPRGASGLLKALARAGVVTAAQLNARWTIYLASDLSVADRDRSGAGEGADDPLGLSVPLPEVDREGIETTLDGLIAELDRLDQRTKFTLANNGAKSKTRAGN